MKIVCIFFLFLQTSRILKVALAQGRQVKLLFTLTDDFDGVKLLLNNHDKNAWSILQERMVKVLELHPNAVEYQMRCADFMVSFCSVLFCAGSDLLKRKWGRFRVFFLCFCHFIFRLL